MGEVYRATDTKLNRDVALKVLPDAFRLRSRPARPLRARSAGPGVAEPSEHRVRSTASKTSDGVHALVLELVEGPTLADRIGAGPHSARRSIADRRTDRARRSKPRTNTGSFIATEAGEHQGATRWHGQGAGLWVWRRRWTSRCDTRCVVDHSVADDHDVRRHAARRDPRHRRLHESRAGARQNRRQAVRHLGLRLCAVYEMLTGKPAFEGSDVADVLANVLKSELDWSALPAEAPSAIRRVLQRCLAKDPRRRLHDIADARLDLEERTGSGIAIRRRGIDTQESRTTRVDARCGVARRRLRLYVAERTAVTSADDRVSGRPSGKHVPRVLRCRRGRGGRCQQWKCFPGRHATRVYRDRDIWKSFLWLRPLNSFVARPLTGTDGASLPFWSPNSRSIGFFVAGKLKKMDAGGGPAQTICDVPGLPRGATWARDVVLFSSGNPPGLSRVAADGGTPVPVATPGEARETWPSWPYPARWPSFPVLGQRIIWSRSRLSALARSSPASSQGGSSQRHERGLRFPRLFAFCERAHAAAATFRRRTPRIVARPCLSQSRCS